VLLVRLFDGTLKAGTRVRLMHSDAEHKVEEVGNQRLKRVPVPQLSAGEVGYVLAGMKSLAGLAIGDTLTEADRPAAEPVPGYREAKPVVFSSIYPMATDDYEDLTKALEKLKLNDASLIYEKDASAALGFGFRCGFLGLLHMEIVQERLEREYNLDLITTAPTVRFRCVLQNGDIIELDVERRRLHLEVSDEELKRRRAAWKAPASPMSRGYTKLYFDHVQQADKGADLDFLVGASGSAVPKDNH